MMARRRVPTPSVESVLQQVTGMSVCQHVQHGHAWRWLHTLTSSSAVLCPWKCFLKHSSIGSGTNCRDGCLSPHG